MFFNAILSFPLEKRLVRPLASSKVVGGFFIYQQKEFFMKNTKKYVFLAIVALAAIIGLTACDDSITGEKGNPTPIPIANDFNISGQSQIYDGYAKIVSISPKSGKSDGIITIYYESANYTKRSTAPTEKDIYTVTFDVEATEGWKAARDLSAGTLQIADQVVDPVYPTEDDFIFSDMVQVYDGNPKPVSISPLQGKSQGIITIYYEGTNYSRKTTAPSAIGEYTVTFDITESQGWYAESGLYAGTLYIGDNIPIVADFTITGLSQFYDGSPKEVSIIPNEGKSAGKITIYYEGTNYPKSTTAPSEIGTYTVTFDVAAHSKYSGVKNLEAGILTINLHAFTSISELATILATLPNNTAATPYLIVLNISNLSWEEGSLGNLLYSSYWYKYISLDLSSSTITSIGEEAFSGCENLTSITMPNSVRSIGESAFSWCSSLTNITIPNSVTSIGAGAFSDCSSLTNITIPNSVTSIGESAFSSCSSLTSITIPNNVTSIEYRTFISCSSLTSVIIPNSVTSIEYGAFSGCSSLTSVTIGNSVTSIGYGAFFGCTSLTEINVNGANTKYSSSDGVLYNKDKTGLIICPGGKTGNFTIPNNVTSIGGSAFSYCTSLTSVTINGNYIQNFSGSSFSGCTSLTAINVSGNDIYTSYSSSDGVLYNKDKTELIICPGGKTGAFTIPNSVTIIGGYAFSGCSSLTSVTIPNSVTIIGGYAFSGCSNLTSVTFAGTIPSSNFGDTWESDDGYSGFISPFDGDLDSKFYATNRINGTPGTYKTTAPVYDDAVWIKQ
jgi:hypothetical protein